MYAKVISAREIVEVSQPCTHTNNELNNLQKTNLKWKDAQFELYEWVHFDIELRRVFCKTCKGGSEKYVFIT